MQNPHGAYILVEFTLGFSFYGASHNVLLFICVIIWFGFFLFCKVHEDWVNLAKHCASRIHTALTRKRHSIHICWMNRLVSSQSFVAGLWASSNCSWTLRTIHRFACLEMTNGHCFLDRKLQSQDSNSVSLTQKPVFYSLLQWSQTGKTILNVFRDISKGL